MTGPDDDQRDPVHSPDHSARSSCVGGEILGGVSPPRTFQVVIAPLRSRELLPGILQEIADIVGPEAAIKIAACVGGTRAYFPAKPDSSHWTVELLGQELANTLCAYFSGERIDIPTGPTSHGSIRTALIRLLIREGKSASEIARLAHVTQRTVHRQRQQMRKECAKSSCSRSIPDHTRSTSNDPFRQPQKPRSPST